MRGVRVGGCGVDSNHFDSTGAINNNEQTVWTVGIIWRFSSERDTC